MRSEAENGRLRDAVPLHSGDHVGDEGMPVAHAYVHGLAERLGQEAALEQRPAGQRGSFRQRRVTHADLGIAVLELFDHVLRHGPAAGDQAEVLAHLVELVGGAVREEKDGAAGLADRFRHGTPPPGQRFETFTTRR